MTDYDRKSRHQADDLVDLRLSKPGAAPSVRSDRLSAEQFRLLYLELRPELESLAWRFVKRPQEVEDLVQDTLLRLYLSAIDFESHLHALSFARRVLTNLCIDRFRAAGRRPTLISLDVAPAHQLPELTDSDDAVLRAEDASVVRAAVAQLSPDHRAALIKREIEEKPLSVIAAELGIPAESVKHLLFRARRSLRRLLVGTLVEPGMDPEAAEPLPRDRECSGDGFVATIAF